MEKVILTPGEINSSEAHTLDSEILNAYKEGINSYEKRAFDVLDIFQDRKGDLTGSNCFAPLKLREFLPKGTRLATMTDLERAIKMNPDFLKEFYSDTGLALRTAGDSCEDNDFLAKDLAKQLEKRKITLDSPKVIYFDALDLKQDNNSVYGLAYNLNEKAALGVNIIDAPELMNDMKFKTMNEKGIPVMDNKGDRNLYTKKDGLSRFSLDRGLYMLSFFGYLSDSDDDGSVIVVSGEDTSQKIKQEGEAQ